MAMQPVHHLRDNIAVVGWSCRLPGANSVRELWSMLLEGRCAVSKVPADRFHLDKFGHPHRQQRGKSYTWAAGVLDDIWGFDPGVFGVSPREAVQIDPQQRILLQLTWEALEDAGIQPSSIANSDVGVFIGASQTDYGHAFFGDTAIADAHFAPGTALAILANRISYVYNLQGPSITVDTACSSSLVALHQAVEALRSGRIETAIVGGSNLIASPASFIAFSQANMLSPNGLCQAFSAQADGFVRAEGAVVLVLRKAALAQASRNPIHGLVLATDVNSDGRTNGISLPSIEAQEALLERVYARNGIDIDRLAFVEAHGTGTPVGDPIEATAIGRTLGRHRSDVLPIGSIKTNIGHLEPASGLAGLLKGLLSLNHGVLPPSLHFKEPSPHIKFSELNLSVCTQPLALPKAAEQVAGVNSFGFGGTNAHAVIATGRKPRTVEEPRALAPVFAISAGSRDALTALARDYANRIPEMSEAEVSVLPAAVAHRRELQSHRAVVTHSSPAAIVEAMNAFASGEQHPDLTVGEIAGVNLPIAFVYSGNGAQWAGMGVAAYQTSEAFKARFDQVDALFRQVGGWSLKDAMFSDTLAARLPMTSIAQPLIFAIQTAATAALKAGGLRPAAVLGHSVGEVAAAEAAGILDLRTAVKVIHFRSTHQEATHGLGRMAAVLASAEDAQLLVDETPEIELAAINSPRAVTVAGSNAGLQELKRTARKRGIAVVDLDLDYPFHTKLMAPIEQSLKGDLRDISPRDADVPFLSTVTGACLPGSRLDGTYWWRNVREPVHFADAVRAAAELGIRYFVEVGARPTLIKHITDTLQSAVHGFAVTGVLDRDQDEFDPFARARAKAIVAGAQVHVEEVFGPDPGPAVSLPHYPWQQTQYRFKPTVEAIENETQRHPFAGARASADALVWRAHIDTALWPDLSDHQLGEQVIFPGTGFLEIALSVAKEWLGSETVSLTEFEILNPLDLTSGETREVMTRVSPGSRTLEIHSRPRLSQASWLLHCRTKIQPGHAIDGVRAPAVVGDANELSGAELYRLATASGLNYGSAFRLVERALVHDDGTIEIDLTNGVEGGPFLLDPMRLDASAHGFFTVFPELRAVERGVTYIPVRLQEVALYRPHLVAAKALIKIVRKSDRFIIGNSHILDREGAVIAVLRGVRSQAVSVRRTASIASAGIVESLRPIDGNILGRTGVGASAKQIASYVRLRKNGGGESAPSQSEMLLDGWALAASSELAFALSPDGKFDLERLVATGRLPERLRHWALNILGRLESAGLAARSGDVWKLVRDRSLPRASDVVAALLTEHQAHSAEAFLAAAVDALIAKIGAGDGGALADFSLPKSALDLYYNSGTGVTAASSLIENALAASKGLWPQDRVTRVLQIGHGRLTRSLLRLNGAIALTVFESGRGQYESAALEVSRLRGVELVGADNIEDLERFDLVVSPAALHRLPANFGLPDIRRLLAPGGLLVAVEPMSSLFKELVFGLEEDWFKAPAADAVFSPLQDESYWMRELAAAGFENVQTLSVRAADEPVTLFVADSPESADTVEGHEDVSAQKAKPASLLVIAGAERSMFAGRLSALLENGESPRFAISTITRLADFPAEPPAHVVFLAERADSSTDSMFALTQRCLDLKDCAERIGGSAAKLWLVFSGALNTGTGTIDAVETGAWAFTRTLANEYPKLDVRRIEISPKVSAEDATAVIKKIILSGTEETELAFDGKSLRAVRMERLERVLDRTETGAGKAARLERRSKTGERLSWRAIDRKPPAAGEVEIEIEAIGVNFRDLMFSMSLLPEDMLEDGFSGPTLGLECAGRIAKVGKGVRDLEVGERVMAFAASSFSTHVTVQRSQAVRLPQQLAIDAAATIPVAFFTAYYSLITQAKLARNEWVLIHGGAGAVGMAAVQIAQWKKARVIATAGSPAKRELLRSLGVRHVLDSRSTSFVDDVRSITGEGVDVVLNSLAGEAMEWSIACLRPFGRFVELGKRDYVTNTHIGLRPFRRNLSYFGVDVDQVIGARRTEADKIFAQIVKMFEKGTFVPLPYNVFDAEHIAQAFNLMQQSSHIGKIVVRPPSSVKKPVVGKPFVVASDKTHVVTGAFGGFGLESAKWLVDRGARHLVLIGRKGAVTPEAQEVLQDFAERGVKVIADPCDVTDLTALQALFRKISARMPPVTGVLHEAMVLDDAILSNLDAERFRRVFAPKVIGADNLDFVLRGKKLDYFVLFSSVTTLIGNPGQANYVAANAYMEGLARARRCKGLPALAIGWGPILDVGVVARSEKLQSGLQKLTGVSGLQSREALDLMAEALSRTGAVEEAAVLTVAPNEGGFAAERLAVLRSPSYADLLSSKRAGDGEAESIDLHGLAAREGVEAARRKVADVISLQLSHVLHLREEDISRVRPLGEIGLDSLMALELVMNLEERFGLKVPLSGSSGGMTITDIANEIMAHVGLDRDEDDAVVEVMAVQHQKDLSPEHLKAVKSVMVEDTRAAKRLLS